MARALHMHCVPVVCALHVHVACELHVRGMCTQTAVNECVCTVRFSPGYGCHATGKDPQRVNPLPGFGAWSLGSGGGSGSQLFQSATYGALGFADLVLETCDLQHESNGVTHRTEEMGSQRLVVRRGQPFTIVLHFAGRGYEDGVDTLALNVRTGKPGAACCGREPCPPVPWAETGGTDKPQSGSPHISVREAEQLLRPPCLLVCTSHKVNLQPGAKATFPLACIGAKPGKTLPGSGIGHGPN